MIKEIFKSFGECLIVLLVSTSLVFSIAVIWKHDEFIENVPLTLAWSWQAIILSLITSSTFSLSKIWIKHKARLPVQAVISVLITLMLIIFTSTSNAIVPLPKFLSLRLEELSKDANPSKTTTNNTDMEPSDGLENDPQELPDEL